MSDLNMASQSECVKNNASDLRNDAERSPRHAMALACANAGIPIFPCLPNAKEPATPHGFKDATTDVDQINRWWAEADYNLAMEPERAGWGVVDIDPKHGGDATWAAFTVDMPILATRTVTTPSGGRHLYFKGSLPQTAGKIGPGVDTRGRGSYVLLPGSVINGVEYRSDGADVAELPERIKTTVAPAKRQPITIAAEVPLDLPENVFKAERWLQTQEAPHEGIASDLLYRQAAWLRDYGLSQERIIDMLEEHSPGYDRDDIATRVENAFKHAQNAPAARATNYGVDSVEIAKAPEPCPAADDEVELICGADVEPEKVTWLWQGHYACGKFHVSAAKPETGKNVIMLTNMATITTGGKWPDGTQAPLGDCIIWSGEDSFEDTTLPRFLAAGGNRSRLYSVREVVGVNGEKRPFDPARDVGRLCKAMRKLPELRYLGIDPVAVVVAGGHGASHNNAETRRALQPLLDLAEERGVVVEGITHFSKGSEKRDVLERVLESTAFTAVARVVHVAHKFEDETKPRRWLRAKCNIVKAGGVIGYDYALNEVAVPRYPDIGTAPKLVWGEPLRGSARALIAEEQEPGAKDKAAGWLISILREHGGAMLTKDLKLAAEAHCYHWRTLVRAKGDLGGRIITRQNLGASHGGWSWVLTEVRELYPAAPQNW